MCVYVCVCVCVGSWQAKPSGCIEGIGKQIVVCVCVCMLGTFGQMASSSLQLGLPPMVL